MPACLVKGRFGVQAEWALSGVHVLLLVKD
jgi:hypothetical protein